MNWGAWSQECASMMATRSRDLMARHALASNSAYDWDLDVGEMVIGGVRFGLVTVGTVSGSSFLWSWANDSIALSAKNGIEEVRQFGIEHDLSLLFEPCAPGGLSQAKECLAIAGRIVEASAIWIDKTESGFILFALHERGQGMHY